MRADHLILTGRYEEAAKRLGVKNLDRVRHYANANAFDVRNSIVAHMCSGRFADAEAMAEGMIAKFRRQVSWDYMNAGTVRWFQRRRKQAAATWEDGLTCGYTYYRGIDCALLLWYASIRSPTVVNPNSAIKRMQQPYFVNLRQGYFVDVIARLILDEIAESEARGLARESAWPNFVAANEAQLDFYVAAKHFSRGNRREYQRHMAACAEADGITDYFPELLIARFECGMLPFQYPKGKYTCQRHPSRVARRQRNVDLATQSAPS